MERRFGKPRFGDRRGGGFRDGGFRSGGFRERRDDFPKPVNEGDEFDVEINEIGTKGDGIARVKNFVIFVPDTKEGEKCRIKITMVRPKFAVAEKIGGSQEKDIELKEPEPKVEEEVKKEDLPLEENTESKKPKEMKEKGEDLDKD